MVSLTLFLFEFEFNLKRKMHVARKLLLVLLKQDFIVFITDFLYSFLKTILF